MTIGVIYLECIFFASRFTAANKGSAWLPRDRSTQQSIGPELKLFWHIVRKNQTERQGVSTMKYFAILCLSALFLASCRTELEGPKLKISAPSVTIGGGNGFCPPGQAKKGRC